MQALSFIFDGKGPEPLVRGFNLGRAVWPAKAQRM